MKCNLGWNHMRDFEIERGAAQVRFVIISMILDQNCTTLDSTTTLLHPFWNRLNIGLSQFKYFIDAVLSRFEIKFIHFLGGKNKSFGYNSCKICHMMLFVFHFSPIWLATIKTRLQICLVLFSIAFSLARKKMRFEAKKDAI